MQETITDAESYAEMYKAHSERLARLEKSYPNEMPERYRNSLREGFETLKAIAREHPDWEDARIGYVPPWKRAK